MTRAANPPPLPLFADDAAIGKALLGEARAAEFEAIVGLLETKGFPKRDPVMGARYWPAVLRWFDVRAGIGDVAAPSIDGREDLAAWNATRRRRRA